MSYIELKDYPPEPNKGQYRVLSRSSLYSDNISKYLSYDDFQILGHQPIFLGQEWINDKTLGESTIYNWRFGDHILGIQTLVDQDEPKVEKLSPYESNSENSLIYTHAYRNLNGNPVSPDCLEINQTFIEHGIKISENITYEINTYFKLRDELVRYQVLATDVEESELCWGVGFNYLLDILYKFERKRISETGIRFKYEFSNMKSNLIPLIIPTRGKGEISVPFTHRTNVWTLNFDLIAEKIVNPYTSNYKGKYSDCDVKILDDITDLARFLLKSNPKTSDNIRQFFLDENGLLVNFF